MLQAQLALVKELDRKRDVVEKEIEKLGDAREAASSRIEADKQECEEVKVPSQLHKLTPIRFI